MNYWQILRTIRYLKPRQIGFQVWMRLYRPKIRSFKGVEAVRLQGQRPLPKEACLQGETFTFLNHSSEFRGWNPMEQGALWVYNLNYMDWLGQENLGVEERAVWLDRFVQDLSTNRVGLDPYPIALRGINWVKFISTYWEQINPERRQRWLDSLYAQYELLTRKLEFHLLGNHLLEDLYSLFIAALFFRNKAFWRLSTRWLERELQEQILPDGAHYEQSPMYHAILLDRLLDCYNYALHNPLFEGQERWVTLLRKRAEQMLGHLESILYADGSIPLLNDSAYGIAPQASDLFRYAETLGLQWVGIPLKECGYRKFKNDHLETIWDVGEIQASYQPGHSHSDTLHYELRIDGRPFVIDTGISTYDKGGRRLLERSTRAHNTVVIPGRDSNEVWDGFRVGRRARVALLKDQEGEVAAQHDGYGASRIHQRSFRLLADALEIEDHLPEGVRGVSYLHLAPGVEVLEDSLECVRTSMADLRIEGATRVERLSGSAACRYNRLLAISILAIHFEHTLKYRITKREE